jgi:hypothetical protein
MSVPAALQYDDTPLHELLPKLISEAEKYELGILCRLVQDVAIPEGYDEIVAALNAAIHRVTDGGIRALLVETIAVVRDKQAKAR